MSFESLGLGAPLLAAARQRGYLGPTPIQSAAIPPALAGRDVQGAARTGSGKTQAFGWPVLQRLAQDGVPPEGRKRPVRALVLAPTRELAAQIGESLREDAQHLPAALKIAIAYGGVSINPQMMRLRGGADIVVATPGRLLDLVDHNAVSLADVQVLVLDEADRLLDLGFADELRRVLALLPPRRQTLLFSATFPQAVTALADALLDDPVRIALAGAGDESAAAAEARTSAAAHIHQRTITVDTAPRTQLLLKLIRDHGWKRVLVFVATQYAASHIASKLHVGGLKAEAFHGDLSQGRRTQLLDDFKASRLQVLVATDLAARGIDIEQLPVVVNYDLPRSADDYIHRIGRTGRAGEPGHAVSFVPAASEAHFRLIEKRLGQRVPREVIAGFEPTEAAPAKGAAEAPHGTGGVKGKRPSKKDKLRAADAARAAERAARAAKRR
ncbi:MAG: DEAD/DEAH box helicase [Burkholderiales bacterium]|nr:DEAD/DEAH box helicase [Burkholderiales bacterium]